MLSCGGTGRGRGRGLRKLKIAEDGSEKLRESERVL